MDDNATPKIELPGFRFHPTEEELLEFYLKNMIYDKKLRYDIIGYRNIYHHDPWDLPGTWIYTHIWFNMMVLSNVKQIYKVGIFIFFYNRVVEDWRERMVFLCS